MRQLKLTGAATTHTYHMRRWVYAGLIFGFSLLPPGCSWTIRFLVVNTAATAREIELELELPGRGFMIFDPGQFTLFPYESELSYDGMKRLAQPRRSPVKLSIPPHSALEIGHLSNEKYESSRQQFINGRVFNLRKIKAGDAEVTRDSFDANFKKRDFGYVWILP